MLERCESDSWPRKKALLRRKEFRRENVIDHTRLEKEIKPVAEKIGVSQPTGLAPAIRRC